MQDDTIFGRIIRREVPIMLGSVIAVPLTLYDGEITRIEGLVLVGCALAFTIATLTISARDEIPEAIGNFTHRTEDAASTMAGPGLPAPAAGVGARWASSMLRGWASAGRSRNAKSGKAVNSK